jgi:hypothetical protein
MGTYVDFGHPLRKFSCKETTDLSPHTENCRCVKAEEIFVLGWRLNPKALPPEDAFGTRCGRCEIVKWLIKQGMERTEPT